MIADEEKELLRGQQHHSRHYASFLRPLTLWTARVNNGAIARGATTIAFDGGTGLDWNAVEGLQTLWVGSAAGLNDLGKVRLRAKSSGDGGATGSLTVAANSLLWADNAYLTFKHNYELDARYPWIDPATEIFYKDRDIAYAGQTEEPEPVCVADIYNQADMVREGELYYFFTLARSYPMAAGATITSYACSVYPPTGTAVTIDAGTGVGRIRVTSTSQDYYWAKFTVTDSNGKSQSNYQCLLAHDPIQGRPTYPHFSFNINQVTRAWDRGGCYAQILVNDNASLEDIPDETFCILWRLSSYGAALSENLVRIQAGATTYVNPQLSYIVSGGPAVGDVQIVFTAGILVDGLVPADGLAIDLEILASGVLPETPSPTTSGGVIATTVTLVGADYSSGQIEVYDADESLLLLTVDYEATFPFGISSGPAPVSSYPSPLWVFPQRFITGYVRKDNLVRNLASGVNQDTLEITSVEDLLKNHFMYSISLAARPTPATWYEYAPFLTVGRAVHHILKWHSTLLEVCSVVGLDRNTDGRAYAEFEDGSLYTMPDQLARQAGIRAHLVCSPTGVLNLTEDSQLLTDAERAALTVKLELAKEDMSGELALLRQTEPRVALVHVSGLEFDGNFIPAESVGEPDPKPEVFPYCSMAPGQLPGRAGEGVVNLERQVVRSQAHSNELAGRVLAQANNPYPELRVRFHGDYDALLDPALPELWQVDIIAGDSLREVVLPDLKIILRSTATMFNQGHVFSDVVYEPVAQGNDGVPGVCLDELPEVGGDPEPIDNDGLPGALVTAGSVYYLPPGTSAWTLRTAEATSFLYQDPWWRIKQASITSANAILIRGGVGYLKRSTDGGATWGTVTPASVPPGFGGVMGDLEFFDGEGSYLTSDFHVIMARSNDSGNWESWLWISDDDFATGSWVTVGDASGGTEYTYNPAATGAYSGSDVERPCRVVAYLDDNLFVTVYTDIGNSNRGTAIVGSVSGSVITYGSEVVFDTTATEGVSVAALSPTKFVVVFVSAAAPDDVMAIIGTVSGTTISFGTATQIHTDPVTNPAGTVVQALDGSSFAAAFRRHATATSSTVYTVACTVSGTAITPGTAVNWPVGTTNRIGNPDIAVLSSAQYVISAWNSPTAGLEGIFFVVANITGSTTISLGSTVSDTTLIDPKQLSIIPLTAVGISFVAFYYDTPGDTELLIRPAEVTGASTITLGTAQVITTIAASDSVRNLAMAKLDVADFVIAYERDDGAADYSLNLRQVSYSSLSSSFVVGASYDRTAGTGSFPGTSFVSLARLTLSKAVVVFSDWPAAANQYGKAFTFPFGTEAKGLGLSVGRGLGQLCYVTFWDGAQLSLKSYLLPAGTDDGTVLLGAASESEVDNGERIVYPLAGWHDDERFYLFGRFTGPGGLGFPIALAYSPDYGNTWQAIEDGFGANHIGSLKETPDGKLFAIRNLASQSKLYTGTDSLVVKSTLPFNARVNLRAMTLDWLDNTVVACSASGLSVMVALSVPPYAIWTDITTNHGTASGVKSVEVL